MSYVECPKCGHRALSVATQCPHCGLDFTAEHPKHPVVEEEVPRLRRRLQVAGVLLAVVVVLVGIAVVLYRAGSKEGLTPPPAAPVDSAPSKPSQPAAEKSTKLADSARPVAPAPSTDTARPVTPAPPVVKPPAAKPPVSRVDTTRPCPVGSIPRPASGQRIVAALGQGVGQRAIGSPSRRFARSGLEAR